MPIYIYQNPKNKKIIEIIQSINDKHEYVDQDGIKWNRVFTVPQVQTDQLKSTASPHEFVEYTKNKKGTIGDLWDKSKELSNKREKIYGTDPVKEDYIKAWSKKRRNKKYIK